MNELWINVFRWSLPFNGVTFAGYSVLSLHFVSRVLLIGVNFSFICCVSSYNINYPENEEQNNGRRMVNYSEIRINKVRMIGGKVGVDGGR